MFYYYGRKKQLSSRYPSPQYSTIIEPFAGSAAYSFYGNNWKSEVILIEKDPKVAEIWDWLINYATPESIMEMPILNVGDYSENFLHILHSASKQAFKYKKIKVTPVLARNWEISRRNMALNLYKVKHWKIINDDYTTAPDIEATWFIDPPYMGSGGQGYAYGNDLINYQELGDWILNRRGQIIACEGETANYLPFRPLVNHAGVAGKRNQEFIYTNIEKNDLFSSSPEFSFYSREAQ